MPPWVAFVPRSTSLLASRRIGCLSLRPRCSNVAPLRKPILHLRSASTHVSPTAINVRPNIPPANEELYHALSELSGAAEAYANISRLQLALRGLAAQDAVTRIAVLSIDSQTHAQKLARLLFADPLGSQAQWEKQLEHEGGNGKAVLLRYGEEDDLHPPSPLYRVLSIPSRILRTYNLEVLVSTLNTQVSNAPVPSTTDSSQDAVLVPKLWTSSNRGMPVPFPVHMTLVFGEGLQSAVEFGSFTSDRAGENTDMVQLAINLPPPQEDPSSDEPSSCTIVNLNLGTKALASFRESIANSDKFERGWFRSGMPALAQWLVQGVQPSATVKPVMKSLVSSLTDDVEARVTKEDAEQLQRLTVSEIHRQTSQAMLSHLDSWAERSHTELRDQLDKAFAARNWHKLAWWKLFWRVDDVAMICSEILERRWLVDAEKAGVYLAGRMNQAGFPEVLSHDVAASASASSVVSEPGASENIVPPESESITPSHAPLPTSSSSQTPPHPKNSQTTALSTPLHSPTPWPSQIASARSALLTTTIPPLQALAQHLVLWTLSTTSLSTALSALFYISMPSVSLFEAGAVAALGLVFSLRRMQTLWEGARSKWRVDVREEGRRTLKGTEEGVRLIVRGSGRGREMGEDEGVVERRAAREAVGRVRRALEKMG